jgi:membrane protease subunit (stomatin/prohibitin family)
MAANQTAFAAGVRDQARPQFETLGLELESVQIQNISLPNELQQRLDERIGMGVVGDMARYAQYQAARAIPIVAAGTGGSGGIGGAASAGIGIGAGVALGQTMAQSIVKATTPAAGQSVPTTPVTPAPEATVACGQCGASLQRRTPFCPECGVRLA